MAEPAGALTDKSVGLALLLGTLTTLGALGMIAIAPDGQAGWAFAAAMLFASLAIVAIHVY